MNHIGRLKMHRDVSVMGVSQDGTDKFVVDMTVNDGDQERAPPNEEFLDQFQQDSLTGTRRVRKRVQDSVNNAPEDGGTEGGSRRPSKRVVLVPRNKKKAHHNRSKTRCPMQCQPASFETPTTIPATSGGAGRPEPGLDSARAMRQCWIKTEAQKTCGTQPIECQQIQQKTKLQVVRNPKPQRLI